MNHHAKTKEEETGARCSTASKKKCEKKKFSQKFTKPQHCGRQESAHIGQPKLTPWTTQLSKPMVPRRKKNIFFLAPQRPHIYDMDEYSRVSFFLHSTNRQRILPSLPLPSVHRDHHPGTRKAGSELYFESSSNRDQPESYQLWTDQTHLLGEERGKEREQAGKRRSELELPVNCQDRYGGASKKF